MDKLRLDSLSKELVQVYKARTLDSLKQYYFSNHNYEQWYKMTQEQKQQRINQIIEMVQGILDNYTR